MTAQMRALAAEAIGTGALVATVVGSGIMAAGLSADAGMALLGNTLPTGAILFVLITLFAPVSGAHFNPCVTMIFALRGQIGGRLAATYIAAQIAGGCTGTLLAHAMFEAPLIQIGQTARHGGGAFVAEIIATAGLVGAILGGLTLRPALVPTLVALYITAAYWFTASTSFANPAVTVARALTDSFAGIAPHSVPVFVAAQIIGALAGLAVAGWLFTANPRPATA